MRALIQRVSHASVVVDQITVGKIERGFVVFLGVQINDTDNDLHHIVHKIAKLRIFSDAAGKFNLDLQQVAGSILLISQFTLFADCSRGNRPSFSQAAPPAHAQSMYDRACKMLREQGLTVAQGVFQAHMQVSLCNDGPVTVLLDSNPSN